MESEMNEFDVFRLVERSGDFSITTNGIRYQVIDDNAKLCADTKTIEAARAAVGFHNATSI